jgi:yeast amino acid transporter
VRSNGWCRYSAHTFLAGDKGRFLAVCSAFITATLAFLGCEIVGVAVGEAENPRRAIPRAIKLTFWRIVTFYILLVLLSVHSDLDESKY